MHDSADWVRFRGRWANQRMLEVYIQEVAADDFLTILNSEAFDRVQLFADTAAFLLSSYLLE